MMLSKEKRKGFTLTEVIITLIILSMLGLIVTIVFNVAFASRDMIDREASIQAEMRLSMQNVNNSVEKSTAIFILDETGYDPSDSNFKRSQDWNYIGLSADGGKILNHIWNKTTKTWDVKELGAKSLYDLKLTLNFDTETDYQDNRVVKYDVQGQYPDSKNVLKIDTAIMALNTKQVFSKVSKGKKGIALAYRTDPIKGQNIPSVAVSIVFDVSTSMERSLDGYDLTRRDRRRGVKDRMQILKEKAKGLVDDLSEIGKVRVNLVEFGTRGEYILPDYMDLATSKDLVKTSIDKFTPKGSTNPGSGLRYGLVSLAKEQADIKYVIILTDGGPNVYTRRRQQNEQWSYDVNAYDLTTDVTPNDFSHDVWGDDVRPINGNYPPLYYPGQVAKKFGTGVNHIHFIGYSGVSDEKDAAKTMTQDINKSVPATYHDAADGKSLETAFSKISDQLAQALWFVAGP